jgi:hypothetical protein
MSRQVNRRPFLRFAQKASDFSRHVETGRLTKAEFLDILKETVLLNFFGNLGNPILLDT